MLVFSFLFFKQKTAYEMRISDWSSDVCSSDLVYGQDSKSIGRYRSEQILQDVYDAGSFQTASCVGQTLPVSGKQCMDLPWMDPFFLRGEMTPEQVAYMFEWEEGKTVYRSEEHTSELQSLMRISYAVFCLKKKKNTNNELHIRP